MLALMIVSLVILVWGFIKGYPESAASDNGTVDPLLYWAYIMLGIALFCVVVFGIMVAAMNNPKSLIKLLIGLVAIVVVCGIVYAVSKGAPAVGLTTEQPDASTLKLTDTVLNLTYLAGGLAILAIIAGEIISAIRNK